MKKILLSIMTAVLACSTFTAYAAGGSGYPHDDFSANLRDKESMQRGAKLFVNYCAGCHSLEFQRYNRTFKDLGIIPEIGAENLIFTGAKAVEQMHNAMDKTDAGKWFGAAAPDLSLTARAKGSDYIYNYLRGFYVDDSRPLGFNNAVFPGASMPNPLWMRQGLQKPVYQKEKHCETVDGKESCNEVDVLTGFELVQKGTESAAQYNQTVTDITNFLTYVSDPSALVRMRMGPWVLAFIAVLTMLFYFLKREYWRDVH
ncbi:MAG: cytochrome c1 [Cardiobacteriaceae bacterium]|nr:cytochrome c1 [Cardiobacteriaceae bacterium]